MTDLLYLMSDTGGGHRSAANALIASVETLRPREYQQAMIDVFSEGSRFLNFFARLYGPTIKYFPLGWKLSWYWLHHEGRLKRLEQIARPFIDKKLKQLVQQHQPRLMVSVHPLVNHLVAHAISDLGVSIPLVTVVTDPISVHPAWISPRVDSVVVATEMAAHDVLRYGYPREKLVVLGMPIHPHFSLPGETKVAIRQQLALDSTLTTILLTGGGEGAGKMDRFLKVLAHSDLPIQVIVVAGRNERFRLQGEALAKNSRVPLKIFGFTHEMPRLMEASDLIITKAGPGTIFEALAKELPMLITSWVPGQEEGNARFVAEEGLGEIVEGPETLLETLKPYLQEEVREKIKTHIRALKRPQAGLEIAQHLFKFVDKT